MKPMKKWRIQFYASDGIALDSLEHFSRIYPTRFVKGLVLATGETVKVFEITEE
jgi:hypothetical protein